MNIALVTAASFLLLGACAIFVMLWRNNKEVKSSNTLRSMLASDQLDREEKQQVVDEIKSRTSRVKVKKKEDDLATKLFKAGYYTELDKTQFNKKRMVSLFVGAPAIGIPMYFWVSDPTLSLVGILLGAFVGYALPMSRLDKAIRLRQEEVLYYLPLVIEEISIGVSSGLDIGPCISQIIEMSKERNSPNPVIEMFMHVEKLIQAGLSMEDSLNQVADAYGQREVRHAFLFLSQCSKHGGEVSKQLQDLADAVATQREIFIESKITALPVKATGPLAMVFMGFFIVLLGGIVLRITAGMNGQ